MTSLVIGRDETCDIVLEDSFVSRRHVRLDLSEDGDCKLVDLGSTNGTFLFKDAEYVTVGEVSVGAADHIRIGHLDYTVDQLVRLARRPLWQDAVEPIRATRELKLAGAGGLDVVEPRTMRLSADLSAAKRWHPVGTVAFVIGANLLLWSLVFYFTLSN